MEITNDYYESLLDDPVEVQETPVEEQVVEDVPFLPEQPSDEPTDTTEEPMKPALQTFSNP